MVGGDGAEESPSREEDIRPQLLRTEPMVLTPPQSQEKVSEVARLEMVDKEVQTEQVPGKEDRVEGKLDSLKAEVAEALTSVFQYMEQLKSINLSQETANTALEHKVRPG